MRQWIIVDMDGTIADCRHRLHLIKDDGKNRETRNWFPFFEQLINDDPIWPIINLIKLLATQHQICIMTARMIEFSTETQSWLQWHGVIYDELLMRPAADFRNDDIVKKQLYQDSFKQRDMLRNVALVLEDRNRCVKMWRELGLTCLQVQEGNY